MKVRMKTISAGPEGTVQVGEVVNVPATLAQALIEHGYAEEVVGEEEAPHPGPPPKEGREAAAVKAPETAAKPKAKAKARRGKSAK